LKRERNNERVKEQEKTHTKREKLKEERTMRGERGEG